MNGDVTAKSRLAPIVLFDGDCAACSTFVRFVLDRDSAWRFHFAPLQGTTAKGLLGGPPDLGTIVLAENGQLYVRSEAVLRIVERLGFPWSLCRALRLIPRFVRDFFYKLFAANRHRLGRVEECRMLTPDENKVMLP